MEPYRTCLAFPVALMRAQIKSTALFREVNPKTKMLISSFGNPLKKLPIITPRKLHYYLVNFPLPQAAYRIPGYNLTDMENIQRSCFKDL